MIFWQACDSSSSRKKAVLQCTRARLLIRASFMMMRIFRNQKIRGKMISKLTILALQMRRRDEAMSAFDESIRLDSRNGHTHYHYGVALEAVGRADEALNALENALRLNPSVQAKRNIKRRISTLRV